MIPFEIEFHIKNTPNAAELYDRTGKLVCSNFAWNNLWDYKSSTLPDLNIFENKLMMKTGIINELEKLFQEGGIINTIPVICETGDLDFSEAGIGAQFQFCIYSINDEYRKATYLMVIIKKLSEDISNTGTINEVVIQSKSTRNIIDILELERKRVAQELHDNLGQKILAAKLGIELFQKKSKKNSIELKQSINQLIDISKEIKSIIHAFHPVVIERYSLIDALDLLIHEFNDTSGINTSIKYFGNPEYENLKIDLNIYRIFQESLNNIIKHSAAQNVAIECHFATKMIIGSILDDGDGFDINEIRESKMKKMSYGLISMQERAKAYSGELTIESQIGEGTKIYFHIPIGS